jgi:hypothetical protein
MENSLQPEDLQKQHIEDSELENASGGILPVGMAFAGAAIAAQVMSDTVLGTDTAAKRNQGFKDVREGNFIESAKNFAQATPAGNLIGKLIKKIN